MALARKAPDVVAANPLPPARQNLSRRLAEFAGSFRLEHAPASVLENAKLAILDCLGVAVLATTQEIGKRLRNFARAHSGNGPCTVWGTDLKVGARDAALLNGTLAHGLDYDDRNHSSTYTLAATVAAAENSLAPGRDALEAFVVGREIRASLDRLFSSRNAGIGPGARGWHANGILGPISAACAVSKILRLETKQTLAAIGLAAGSCGALTRDGGTMAKPFRCGHSAAAGMTSALLAREGWSSDAEALEGRFGLLEALGPLSESILDSLGNNLGSEWNLSQGLRIKPFASCTATHSGLEAMLRLVQREQIGPTEVVEIECDLKPYPLVRERPARGFEGRFSMPFCLANALVHKRLAPDDFTDERLAEAPIQNIIRRTKHRPGGDAITVTLKNGSKLSEPLQPPTNFCDSIQVSEKFLGSVSGVISQEHGQFIINHVLRIEELSDLRPLTQLLQAANEVTGK